MRPFLPSMILLMLTAGGASAQDAAAGEKVFMKCKVCHQLGENAKTLVGPVLNGVVGRPSASIEGYNYSDGMKNAHLTWSPDQLSDYLKNPKQKVPGNKMAFVGLSKPEDIANVIAYLQQFGADGKKTQ
jgi:cytochrome c